MKCQKCGYVSFDYLSECRKCSANLMAVRDGLGLSSVKPEIPFLLGTLLRDSIKPAAEQKREERVDFESNLPPIELDEEFTLGSGHELKGTESVSGIHFDDVELQLADAAIQADTSAALQLHAVHDAHVDLVLADDETLKLSDAPTAASQPGALTKGDEDIPLELSDEDLDRFIQDIESSAVGKEISKHQTSTSVAASSSGEDTLEIELTDADMETLLLDLGDKADKKTP